VSQITPESNYDCDPYIPGAMPDGTEGTDCYAPTLAYRINDLERDLVGADGQVVANAGEEVLELGFTGPFDPLYDARHVLDRRLENIAAIHGLYRAMLAPEIDGATLWLAGDDPGDKALVRDKFRNGELPGTVVMHTSRTVAAAAIRQFGGRSARTVASDRPAIHALGDDAATVYMSMNDFLKRRFMGGD